MESFIMSGKKELQGPGISVDSASYPTSVKMTTRQVDGVRILQEVFKLHVVARWQHKKVVASAIEWIPLLKRRDRTTDMIVEVACKIEWPPFSRRNMSPSISVVHKNCSTYQTKPLEGEYYNLGNWTIYVLFLALKSLIVVPGSKLWETLQALNGLDS